MLKTFRSVASSIKLDEEQELNSKVPTRVQVMRTGKFQSPEYGAFEITQATLLSMKQNFDNNVRGTELAIDYSHESQKAAAGWIKQVILSDDGNELWAEIEWTRAAKQCLADKEYRYISADFSFDYEHNENKQKFGPTLFGAGLTNRPFIKGMDAVVELSEGDIKMDEKDKLIEQLKAEIVALKAKLEPPKEPEVDDSPEMAEMKKKLADYEMKEKKAAEDLKCAEKTAAFNKLLSEGKVVEAQRAPYMDNDTVKFSELAQPLNLHSRGGNGNPPDASGDVTKQLLDKANVLLSEKKAKNMGQAISMVLDDPANAALKKQYEEKNNVR